jgi:hypothetical protein
METDDSGYAIQAHWFSMPEFWAQAARLVKPEGTVALWTMSSLYCRTSFFFFCLSEEPAENK